MDTPDEPSAHGSASPVKSNGKHIVASGPNATTPTAVGLPNVGVQGESSPSSNTAGTNGAGTSPSPGEAMPNSLAGASASVESDGKPIETEVSMATDKLETKTKAQQEMEDLLSNLLEKFTAPREPRLDEDAWAKLADEVWTYENDRVKRWRSETSTLLIFAGLLSAVIAAFVSQYYAVLAPRPNFNTAILERISAQLDSMTTDSFVAIADSSGSALTAGSLADSSLTGLPSPPAAPRWIATLWFMSLVISLGVASVALAVNQWLNFRAEPAEFRSTAEKLWTWHLRRDALNKRKVELIVSLLPCLLQVALVFFLIGIAGYLMVCGADIAAWSPSASCFSSFFPPP